MAGPYLFAEDLVTKYTKLVQPIRQSTMVLLRVEINSEIYSTSPWAFGVNRRYGTVEPLTDVGMPSRIVSIAAFHRRVHVKETHSWATLADAPHMVYLPRLPPDARSD